AVGRGPVGAAVSCPFRATVRRPMRSSVSKARFFLVGGLLAAGAATVFALGGQGSAGAGAPVQPDSSAGPAPAAEPAVPEKEPVLVGTLSDVTERRRRAVDRALEAWAEAKDLMAQG